jgi:hypothetical protein
VSIRKSSEPSRRSRQGTAPPSLPARRGTNGPTSDLEFSVTGRGIYGIAAKLRAKTTGVPPFAIALAVAMTMIGAGVTSLLTALACRLAGVTGLPVGLFCLVAPVLAIIAYVVVSCCRPVTQKGSRRRRPEISKPSGDQV